jgi:hypothetical protein
MEMAGWVPTTRVLTKAAPRTCVVLCRKREFAVK